MMKNPVDYYDKLQNMTNSELEEILEHPENHNEEKVIETMQLGFERNIITPEQEEICNNYINRKEKSRIENEVNITQKTVKESKDNEVGIFHEVQKEIKEKGTNYLVGGIVLVFFGILLTIASYTKAIKFTEEKYSIMYGAIIVGISLIIRGIIFKVKIKKAFKGVK